MSIKTAGISLIIVGLLGLVISLGADLAGIGSPGIQAAQLLGAQLGAAVAIGGLAVLASDPGGKLEFTKHLAGLKRSISSQPLIFWALAGFLLAYLLFFVIPMFLDYRLQFQYFYRYLPDNVRIGLDIRTIAKHLSLWLVDGKSPYLDNVIFYPPLYNIIAAPIILLGYPNSYYFMLALGLSSYFLLTFIIPARLNPTGEYSFLLLFFITGIFSYGLQFELERAQFNLVTFLLCIFSIYLFHRHEKYRFFAYLLFSISVQLKVFPLIFILMFIKDWRDWKNNIFRLAGIGLFNFALLFILGYKIFLEFVRSTVAQVSQAGAYTWIGNHSIKAFVYNFTKDGFGFLPTNSVAWLRLNSGLLELLLLLCFAACFLSILVASYLRKERGLNPTLLVACTIGAMVVPSVSHDYKLAILAAPLAIAFNHLSVPQKESRKAPFLLIILIASFAYSATLFPFKYRPDFLENSFPLLLVILVAMTIAYHLDDRASRFTSSQAEPVLD